MANEQYGDGKAHGQHPVQVPSVGRDVHYVSYGSPVDHNGNQKFTSKCRAAKITEVEFVEGASEPNETVSLAVFNPSGLHFDAEVWHDEQKSAGSWHWPERV